MNTINGLLADLKQKIENVRKAHQATLHSANADTISYSDQLSEDARNSRQQCKDAIKALAKQAKGNKQLKAQVDTVNKEFQMLLKEHQAIETTYRNQTKERAVRQFKIVKPDATDEELKAVTSEDNPQIFAQALLNTTAYGAARNAYREVQDRHTEIQKIQKSMEELGQMFNEMAMLVEQQDEDIRQIEGNAQDVDTNVTKG